MAGELQPHFGALLREWRRRRRMSQLDLALRADVSTRHLSYVETGRSKLSPTMVSRLGEGLDLALREQNTLLLAAGYAPPTATARSPHPSSPRSRTRSASSSTATSPTLPSFSTAAGTSSTPTTASSCSSKAAPRTCSNLR